LEPGDRNDGVATRRRKIKGGIAQATKLKRQGGEDNPSKTVVKNNGQGESAPGYLLD
jgi:hypothetical protein